MPAKRAPMPTDNYITAVITVVIAVAVNLVVAPAVGAQAVTCQGRVPTVVGPTDGGDTIGTEGADVIVATLGGTGQVDGLGGDDIICLVDNAKPDNGDLAWLTVEAGAGADSILNDTAGTRGDLWVVLGPGADHYVGDDDTERVFGSEDELTSGSDADPDVIETGGGHDSIYSGSSAPGFANQDVISTGSDRDYVRYWGAAGGTLDNGPDADWLFLLDHWTGELAVDNATGRASLGDQTMLTWTAVDGLALEAVPGSYVSYVGSDAAEALRIDGTVRDVTAPSELNTGGGDDSVYLYDYLPARVDTGDGNNYLKLVACDRATIALASSARCTTSDGRHAVTALAGIDRLYAWPITSLDLRGTPHADRIWAFSRHVLVRSRAGADASTPWDAPRKSWAAAATTSSPQPAARAAPSSAGPEPTCSGETRAQTSWSAAPEGTPRMAGEAGTGVPPKCASTASRADNLPGNGRWFARATSGRARMGLRCAQGRPMGSVVTVRNGTTSGVLSVRETPWNLLSEGR